MGLVRQGAFRSVGSSNLLQEFGHAAARTLEFNRFPGSSLRTRTRRGMGPKYCAAIKGLARHRNHLEWLR